MRVVSKKTVLLKINRTSMFRPLHVLLCILVSCPSFFGGQIRKIRKIRKIRQKACRQLQIDEQEIAS